MSEACPSRVRRAVALLLVIAYAALIFGGSSRKAPEAITDLEIPDFLLHMVEYGGLAFLLSRWIRLQFGRSGFLMLVLLPALLSTVYGITDEIHQGFVAARDGSALDVLADALGSLAGAGTGWLLARGRGRKQTAAAVALVLLLASGGRAAEEPVAAAAAKITVEDLRAHASFLASPELKGRDTPSTDIDIAARYLAMRFRSFGLEPGAADGGWFQEVPITFRVERGGTFVRLLGEGSARTFDGEHVGMPSGSPDGLGAGPVCFAGYGMVAADAKWDDYAGLDVVGKVVVVFDASPVWRDRRHALGRSRSARRQAYPQAKARLAEARGAVALLFVKSPKHGTVDRVRLVDGSYLEGKMTRTGDSYRITRRARRREYVTPAELDRLVLGDGRELVPDGKRQKPVEILVATETRVVPVERVAWVKEGVTPLPASRFSRRLLRSGRKPADGIPVLEVSADVAEALLDRKLDDLAEAAFEGNAGFFGPGGAVVVRVRTEIETATARNVVAKRPARDRKDQAVILCAHYDHVGTGSGGEVYAGADDNASGTTVVLGAAKAFSALPRAPSRPVYFVAFAGEERGFLGSSAFVADPPVPLDDILVVVNLDMVGRGVADEIRVMMGPLGTNLADAFRRSEEGARIRPFYEVLAPVDGRIPPLTGRGKLNVKVPRSGYFGRSDQVVFYRKGIPAVFLFGGLHEDYHRPSDTPDKLNYVRMQRVGRFVFRAARDLAENGLSRPAPVVPR